MKKKEDPAAEHILQLKQELAALEARREEIQNKIAHLETLQQTDLQTTQIESPGITAHSPQDQKIALFRSLFRGREDVFPKRFESKRTGRQGYQPVCRNQWIRPICRKPKIKCAACDNRDFESVSDTVIRNHLLGVDPDDRLQKDFVIGVYPLLSDETCWFLAVDFDKEHWADNARAYVETCGRFQVPAYLERSRSGNGAHVWVFFSEPLPVKTARQLGAFMLTQTMETRPEMSFRSYDRFFPSQDTIPKGGFGSLIALPLQKWARKNDNSVFVDQNLKGFPDQWGFLSSIQKMILPSVQSVLDKAPSYGGTLGVRFVSPEDDGESTPWLISPSGKKPEPAIKGPLPDSVELILGNQIYIDKNSLTPALKNRLIRLAAFQNPEFYKAQAMRFPTYGKSRIMHCCENFPQHIGLPRGCLEDVMDLLHSLKIETPIVDKRFAGLPLDVSFTGILHPDQQQAADAMLAHDTGVLSASTAFGKTVIAAYLIAKRAVNTLILVHRKQLLEQWMARLNEFLDLNDKSIGHIGGGKRKPTGSIDIAMIQSISKKGVVDDVVAEYGQLIVDECHHISARSFEIAARQSKCRFITGLSATVFRKDGHHPIIFMNCGPIRHRVVDKKQAAKRPFAHKVIVRKTGFTAHSIETTGYSAIHEIYESLITNTTRNKMIVSDVLKAIEQKKFPVVLTERKKHLKILQNLLQTQIRTVIVMQGGMGKKQQKAALQALEQVSDDQEKVILATGRYLGEGFDDHRLDTLFLTLPISWKGTIAQYAGRLHRIHSTKKEVCIYDYADLKVPMLSRMYERRLTGYRSIGYEITQSTT